ncbi:MAG TPA: type II toxin-antitoxin system VapC family toxin [Desulfuromonadales bacterium]|nr:type II toxin-antitoxin system VapC family toxin [Desulfuromonadales bacterium]
MTGLLLDTHAAIWYLGDPGRLSATAMAAIDSAYDLDAPLYVSAITLIEVMYLGEKRRISEEAAASVIEALTCGNGFIVIAVDEAVANALATIPRNAAPDMPDRIIAATGRMLNVPIVTKDHLIASSGVTTIW